MSRFLETIALVNIKITLYANNNYINFNSLMQILKCIDNTASDLIAFNIMIKHLIGNMGNTFEITNISSENQM